MTYLGNHTLAVMRGLNMGVALFIVSEALFFLAIFWAYFHSVRRAYSYLVLFISDYFSIIVIVTELGRRENQLLNLAFRKNISQIKLIKIGYITMVFMVKAILLEVYQLLSSKKGNYHVSNGIIERIFTLRYGANIRERFTRIAISNLNVENGQPKNTIRTERRTTGLPNGSNPYGNRAVIVPLDKSNVLGFVRFNIWLEGRAAAKTPPSCRSYCIGCTTVKSKIAQDLGEIYKRSQINKDRIIDRNLYKLICSKELMLMSYEKLKSKPGNMTQGIVPETLDGMSSEILDEIIESLKSEKFQFSPGRRISIPKSQGGNRPLTIAPPRDKLVQEGMRIILEAIWEALFLENSHGFRPNRGCHTALKQVSAQFQPITWVIEGDISKCFDSIDHQKLMFIIESKISDRKFTRLIWKSLKAGYFEFSIYSNNIVGTPQGSIISPILSNIFMNQLDVFVNELKNNFEMGEVPKRHSTSLRLQTMLTAARKKNNMTEVKQLAKRIKNMPSTDFHDLGYRKLTYVRYADDWIIGIRGSLIETRKIMEQVREYLLRVGLNLSETKTRITNLNDSKVLFLGTEILRARKTTFHRNKLSNILRRNPRKLRLQAPINRIRTKLHVANLMKDNNSYPKYVWLSLEHRQILHMYNAVLRGYLNYYSFVHNYGRMAAFCVYTLKQSCAKLLAAKYSLGTMAKVYQKFGIDLGTTHVGEHGKKKEYTFYKTNYKIKIKFLTSAEPSIQSLFGSKSIANLDNLNCSICGSTYRVEMHHVRHLKDLNPKLDEIDKLMASRKRKQIPLCRSCHMVKHRTPSKETYLKQKRGYHYQSLKRKGKDLILFKEK